MPLTRYANLAQAPLHYDRFIEADYGTRGRPVAPLIEDGFAAECSQCFAEIGKLLKPTLGALQVIATGGVGRVGSGRSMHHRNRAFDLDGLFFEKGELIANQFPDKPHLYLAVESVIRRHFGVVLCHGYDDHHRHHIHFDNSRGAGFRRDARSHTLYVQNAMSFVYFVEVGRDGVWGLETDAAFTVVREELKLGPLSHDGCWKSFCQQTAARAAAMA